MPLKTIGFALEHSLGHTTHSLNLQKALAEGWQEKINPLYVTLDFHDTSKSWQRLPGFRSNWSLRASMGAYLGLGAHLSKLDAAFFHTQVVTVFAQNILKKVPSVVSLDATPLQFDTLGAAYGHTVGGNASESLKKRVHLQVFRLAKHLVTWSEWAKASLVNDYAVPAEKVTVIPPGIDTYAWDFGEKTPKETVQILFVGGDFARKGGHTLLSAFRTLCKTHHAELHIVTKDSVPISPNERIVVHPNLKPNSPELRQRFAEADLFAFPTQADCLPVAVLEAMAAGLPVITTSVAALPEVVRHGETGIIVPIGEEKALGGALCDLVRDNCLRHRLGEQARARARTHYDAALVYGNLLQLLYDL